MDNTVTWLHISDLHARTIESAEQKRCWKALADDIRNNYSQASEDKIGKPDVIFLSGDIVQEGEAKSFDVAGEALRVICDAAEVPNDKVYVVPGNHDILRSKVPKDADELRRLSLRASHADNLREAVDQFWESAALQRLERKFAAYLEFACAYAPVTHGPLGSWVAALTVNGVSLNLCGLNTVWNGGTRELDAAGVPLVGVYQRESVLDPAVNQCDSAVQIVLQHNSTDYLNVIDAVLHESWLGQKDAIVLAGHLHNAQTAERRSIDGRHLSIIGGALYAGYRQAAYRCYSIGRLAMSGELREFIIDLRKQSDRGPFTYDTERYQRAPKGQIKFTQSAAHRVLGDVRTGDTTWSNGGITSNGATTLRERGPHFGVVNYSATSPERGLRLVKDFVSLRLENDTYYARFEKEYHNESSEPCPAVNARIIVNAFPHEPKKARNYYRQHPLVLKELKFRGESEGRALKCEIVHDHDAHKEVMLVFANTKDGEFPIMPNEYRKVVYTFTVPTATWGPYLERNIRLPTDLIECEVSFPLRRIRRVWGIEDPHILKGTKIEPSIKRCVEDGRIVYRWSRENPKLLSRYRINWSFPRSASAPRVGARRESPAKRRAGSRSGSG